jgi:hypothetical protein
MGTMLLEICAVKTAGINRLAVMTKNAAVRVDQEQQWRIIKDFSEKDLFYLILSVLE